MSEDLKKNWYDKLPEPMKVMAKNLSDSFKEYKIEFANTPPETPPASGTTADGKLADGTAFKYTGDKLDKGSIITVVTDGGEVPMPDGEYPLADGTVMVVVSDGTNAVVQTIEPAGLPDEGMSADTAKKVQERITKIVEKFETQFKVQDSIIKKQNIQIENLKLKQGRLANDLANSFSIMEAFGMQETDKPAEKQDNGKLSAHQKKMNLINKN